LSGAAQNQASAIAHRGLEVKLLLSASGRGRSIFLDIPLYRSGDVTILRFLFAFLKGGERYGDFSPTDEPVYDAYRGLVTE
jgi:hypothetical protein